MTLEHLARIWFNHPEQHAIIIRNLKIQSKRSKNAHE
jgi:hypothetical protein